MSAGFHTIFITKRLTSNYTEPQSQPPYQTKILRAPTITVKTLLQTLTNAKFEKMRARARAHTHTNIIL